MKAELLNSTLSSSEHSRILHDMCESGGLLYLAPEQLLRDDVANALRSSNLKRIVIDEAHILVELKNGSAIVFCTTVKMTKELYKVLKAHGYKVGKYHGKMKNKKREKAQKDFISGKTKIMIATNAFGLGIDKPDIRLVVHASLPLSMYGYVQEIGRAGRDGEKSKCVLIYADSDFFQNERILKIGDEQSVKRKLKGLAHLKKFVNTQKCLWRFIEKYFGESKKDRCKKCCNCRLKKL